MSLLFVDRIAVEVDGAGDAVLMLHGLGGSANVWTPLMPALVRHCVIRPELPGSARSARVEGLLSIAGFVAGVERVLEKLGIERAHVAGHSLGTIVALHLAVARPKLVRSLALFGPLLAPPDSVRPGIRARGEEARAGGEPALKQIADALVQSALSSETRTRRPLAVALVRELVMRQTPDGYARSCIALSEAQGVDAARIACPTLLVTGDEDAVAPPQSVRAIGARVPGASVEILRNCGHWTTIEKSDECADLLRRFLEINRR